MKSFPAPLLALFLASGVPGALAEPAGAALPARPNIVIILADDLGYGDVHALNPQRGKTKTPHLDRFAAEGMSFTDSHSGSAVCTPTRYGLLTGRYAWRTRLQSGVTGGFSPPLIAAGRLTVPALLRQHGYATACVGKWHLGMAWPTKDGRTFGDEVLGGAKDRAAMAAVDWTQPIQQGPTSCGFDAFFGISASLDMPPFVFIRNDRVAMVPTTEKTWKRSGPASTDFEAVAVMSRLTQEAIAQIDSRAAAAKAGQPFFLYVPWTAPHLPILPAPEWQGKSGLGAYGDFVMQTDAATGAVLAALERNGLTGTTFVVFTSDNGCAPQAPTALLEKQGHFASAQFRGYKSDVWEGGHRVPFLVRWPGHVKPGTQSPQVICHSDLMATCAEIAGAKLPDGAAEDSVSLLSVLSGMDRAPLHEAVVHHSSHGLFAIRQDRWKLVLGADSGGWGKPGIAEAAARGLPGVQLYDLAGDPGESLNVHASHPDIVARLTALLEKYIAGGRSTPGREQPNDRRIALLPPAPSGTPPARKGE